MILIIACDGNNMSPSSPAATNRLVRSV